MNKLAWIGLGCGGLAAAFAVFLVLVILVGSVAWAPEREWVDKRLSTELPGGPDPLRVTIELAEGQFVVRPGAPGTTVTVDAHIDESNYALAVTPAEEVRRTGALRVALEPRSWNVTRSFDTENEVQVALPAGVPLELAAEVARGETAMELGGLSLTSLTIDSRMGECDVSFSAANPLAVELLELHGSKGELTVVGAGLAKPRSVRVEGSMGEVLLDLAGLPAEPVAIEASMRMGGMILELPPESVHAARSSRNLFAGTRFTHPFPSRDPARGEPAGPLVTLTTKVTMGDLLVRECGVVPHRGALADEPPSR
jgi:hypothetical protein